jgi:NAD(P)-dependent dehydrogenase (short-subunit alcohol dehydrogenase family)
MQKGASTRRTALVSGGNRGIGLETCRQLARSGLRVVLAARELAAGESAAQDLRAQGLDVRAAALDVARADSVAACITRLKDAGVHVDVLVNNAGVYPQGGVLGATPDAFREALDVNLLGAVWTCRAFVPAMLAAGYGRVVNVSSGYGSFGEGLPGPAAYSISKAALGALTVKLAQELAGDVKANAVCPGWVRTRMGGPDAERGVEEAVDGIVWLATLPRGGPSGGFFRDREPIPW